MRDSAVSWLATIWLLRTFAGMVVLLTAIPLLRTGWWIVRGCDFPRLQLGALALLFCVTMLGVSVLTSNTARAIDTGMAVLCGVAAIWHAWHILPYTTLVRPEVADVDPQADAATGLRVLITNLDIRNQQHDATHDLIERVAPDVLVLIEIDDAWHRGLDDLASMYPYRVEEPDDDGLGLALWSRLPIIDHDIRYLVSPRRPSVFATLRLSDGRATRFVGLHPTPPGLPRDQSEGRHDSRIRDAELVIVAREVAKEPDRPWIVAGDFNDVAWSRTTSLFKTISGLHDPRIGRGLYNTYHAGYALLRYPLDHVFVSSGYRLHELRRERVPGSDHFGIFAHLSLDRIGGAEPGKDDETRQAGDELIEEGLEDARVLERENAPS